MKTAIAAGALAGAVAFISAPSSAQTAAPAAAATPANATQVLAKVAAYWKEMSSYQAPVTINGSVKVSFLSVPFYMTGTEYYKAPDKQALKMNNVPSMAKGFENTMSNMGEPQTWTVTYDIALKGTEMHRKHLAYVLFGTPKKGGNVKDVTMWVNVKTYAIESVAFNYNSGATLNLELNHHGLSPYHLPTSVGVQASFPQYKGNATITYGKYILNQPIPDSVFQD